MTLDAEKKQGLPSAVTDFFKKLSISSGEEIAHEDLADEGP